MTRGKDDKHEMNRSKRIFSIEHASIVVPPIVNCEAILKSIIPIVGLSIRVEQQHVIAKAPHASTKDFDIDEDAFVRVDPVVDDQGLPIIEAANVPLQQIGKEQPTELSVRVRADDTGQALFDQPWMLSDDHFGIEEIVG
jgi:hypothetical protein